MGLCQGEHGQSPEVGGGGEAMGDWLGWEERAPGCGGEGKAATGLESPSRELKRDVVWWGAGVQGCMQVRKHMVEG